MSPPIVVRGGGAVVGLLHAALRVASARVGPIAIVGGVAVACRLHQAHRATQDVDMVVEERTPTVVEVLGRLDGVDPDPHDPNRVYVDGVKVDVIPTEPVVDVGAIDGTQRLFVLAHRYALESAEVVRVLVEGDERIDGVLPLATPAALVAMKLHAIQDRRTQREQKRASDGYDLYRLLADLDEGGAVAAALMDAGGPLLTSVREAAVEVLVEGSTRTVRALRSYGDAAMAEVSVDQLTFVAERFVAALATR